MQKLKYVIIGAGANVLGMHRPAFDLDSVELVAAYDRNPERGRKIAAELECDFYEDYQTMLRESGGDVALILTTHTSHLDIALACFEAGYHVLVEKPMTIQVKDADAMINAAQAANRQLGVCFQRRYMPSVLKAKQLINDEHLGEIQYAHLSVLWTRPHLYFNERDWRGTWQGEGGGVLINQAAHNLDMLCFLVGLPKIVKGWTRTQLHPIETEDTVQAMFQWENGAFGSFHVSTAEAGPANHLEIRGTKGYLIFEDYEVKHYKLVTDIRQYMQDATNPYAQPQQSENLLDLAEGTGDHIALFRDFNQAILTNAHPIVDGESSRMSLEVANAILYSAHTHSEITLPLDREAYAAFLVQMQG